MTLARALRGRVLHKRVAYRITRKDALAWEERNVLENWDADYRRDPAHRSAEEDRVALLVGSSPGAVLIYCPDPKMQLKAADVLITWKDKVITLKETDDEPLLQKLRAIEESHKHLWALQIFCDADLMRDAERTQTLRDFSAGLFSGTADTRLAAEGSGVRRAIESELKTRGFGSVAFDRVRQATEQVLSAERGGSGLTRKVIDQAVSEILSEPEAANRAGAGETEVSE